MPDQPQWPFIPAIEGHVPLPKPDPRSANAKSLAFAQALMGNHTPAVPMPRPDPRDWATRAVMPQVGDENTSLGAIHPDALMQSRSGGAFTPPPTIDDNTYNQRAIDIINHNAAHGKQAPIGIPQQGWQQDVSNGLFGITPQSLQQMAASKPVNQNLPQLPKSGFSPTLSPLYMNDTHPLSRPPAPNTPPIFWQPG